jgi:hypothetical protein
MIGQMDDGPQGVLDGLRKHTGLQEKPFLDVDIHISRSLPCRNWMSPSTLTHALGFGKGTNMSRPSSILISGLLLGTFATGFLVSAEPSQKQNKEPSTAALERTRKTMRMLDDVYKTAVVLITDK